MYWSQHIIYGSVYYYNPHECLLRYFVGEYMVQRICSHVMFSELLRTGILHPSLRVHFRSVYHTYDEQMNPKHDVTEFQCSTLRTIPFQYYNHQTQRDEYISSINKIRNNLFTLMDETTKKLPTTSSKKSTAHSLYNDATMETWLLINGFCNCWARSLSSW